MSENVEEKTGGSSVTGDDQRRAMDVDTMPPPKDEKSGVSAETKEDPPMPAPVGVENALEEMRQKMRATVALTRPKSELRVYATYDYVAYELTMDEIIAYNRMPSLRGDAIRMLSSYKLLDKDARYLLVLDAPAAEQLLTIMAQRDGRPVDRVGLLRPGTGQEVMLTHVEEGRIRESPCREIGAALRRLRWILITIGYKDAIYSWISTRAL